MEMEAGRKKVSQASHAEDIKALRGAGLDVTGINDPVVLNFHKEVARQVGVLPRETRTRKCWICGGTHTHGELCPEVVARVATIPNGRW